MALNKYDCLWKVMSENTFEFDSDSIIGLICVICNKVIIDVSQSKCGCVFCNKCIVEYLRGNEKRCPGGTEECLELLSLERDVMENIRLCNKISKLKVKCLSRMCDFKVELIDIDKHLRLCTRQPMTCPYNVIGCDNTDIVTQDEICAHLENEIFSHSKLLKQYIEDLRNEITELKNNNDLKTERIMTLENSTKEEISRIKEEVEFWKRLSTNFETKMKEQKKTIESLTKTEMMKQIVELKNGIKNQIEETMKNEIITIINQLTEQNKETENERQKEMESAIKQISELKDEIEIERKKEVSLLSKECAEQRKIIESQLQNDIAASVIQITKLKNEIENQTKSGKDVILKEVSELKKVIEKQSIESKELKTEMIKINNRITDHKKEIENHRVTEITANVENLKKLKCEMEIERKKEVDLLSSEMNKLKKEMESYEKIEMNKIIKQMADTKKEIENQNAESKKLRSEIITINNQIKEMKNQIQKDNTDSVKQVSKLKERVLKTEDSVITVFVNYDSKVVTVRCNPNIKTEDFITLIEQKGLILGNRKLFCNCSYLETGLTLAEQDIGNNDSVLVMTSL